MRARFRRQAFDAVEINHQKFCETGQRERIERLIPGDAREFAQAERTQLKLFSLFGGRQKKISHERLL